MLSPVRIMQYFKNSICMKRPTPAAYYQYPPQIEPPTKRATYGEAKCEKIEAEPHWSILQIFLPTSANMHAQLANNRISNVWRIISPKKSRQFSFQLIPTRSLPQPWSNHRGLNVVTIYFQFFFPWLANTTPRLDSPHFPLPMQIFKLFCRTNTQQKKNCIVGEFNARGELTKQMKQLYRSLLDWAEYAYVLLFITIVITVYHFLFILSDDPKSTVLDGKPR